jgi:hypothetical protein
VVRLSSSQVSLSFPHPRKRLVKIRIRHLNQFTTKIRNTVTDILHQPIVTGVDIAVWSGIEINVAVICGSVPALKALITRMLGTYTSHSSSSQHKTPIQTLRSRNQSQMLGSGIDRDLEGDGNGMKQGGIQITVQKSIEMKTFYHGKEEGVPGDDGSESDLIVTNALSPNMRYKAEVNSVGGRRIPDV